MFGFAHVCEEIRLDAWVCAITGGVVAAHSLSTYATNLANSFRNPVALVSTVETAANSATACFQYASMELVPSLMCVWNEPGCNWQTVNKRMLFEARMLTEATQIKKTLAIIPSLIEQATSELKDLMIEQADQKRVDGVLARVMTLSTASLEQASLDSSHPALCNLRDACNKLSLHLKKVVIEFLRTSPKEHSALKRLARQVDVMCMGFLAELHVLHKESLKSGNSERYKGRRDEVAEQLRGFVEAVVELNTKGVFNARTQCMSVIFLVQLLFETPWPELVIARARAFICACARAQVHACTCVCCLCVFSRALPGDCRVFVHRYTCLRSAVAVPPTKPHATSSRDSCAHACR
jgi:hypothetical protein